MPEKMVPDSQMCHLTGLDDAEKGCWHAFYQASTSLLGRLSSRLVDEHGLALYEFLLLYLLAKSDGGSARMSDLAEVFTLKPSRMTRQVQRLESQGLVCRGPSSTDGRGVRASITLKGRARAESAITTYAQVVRTYYVNPMTRQQLIALGDGCRRISAPLGVANRTRD